MKKILKDMRNVGGISYSKANSNKMRLHKIFENYQNNRERILGRHVRS